MTESAVAGGDNNLEKVGPNREMRWNSQEINHHGHADVTRASSEKTAEQSADEGDNHDDPQRNSHARARQGDHRPEMKALDRTGPVAEGGFILLCGRPRHF